MTNATENVYGYTKVYISSYTVYIVCISKHIVTYAVIYKEDFILKQYSTFHCPLAVQGMECYKKIK